MNLLPFATKIAKQAGKILLEKSDHGFKSSKKGEKDIVTEADFASEKFIKNAIKKKFPDHMIIAEESFEVKNSKKSDYVWYIDPLDGTRNFSRGLNQYTVSIGITKKDKLIAGVIYAPKLKELYTAEKGKGAFLNGKRLHVSKYKKISETTVATGFPRNKFEDNLPYFVEMMKRSQAIRRFGAASLDLANIACGHFDAYWEFNLGPWDIAAGALLVTEAGGRVTSTDGSPLDLFGKAILATNGLIHKETVEVFKKIS